MGSSLDADTPIESLDLGKFRHFFLNTLAAAKDFVFKGNMGSYFKLSLVVSDELLDPIYRNLIE